MKRLLGFITAICLSSTACTKEAIKSNENQAAVTGSINGTVSNGGAIDAIILANDSEPGLFSSLSLDLNTGVFSASQLKAGSYNIHIILKNGYTLAQSDLKALVSAGKTVNLGLVTVSSDINNFSPSTPIFGTDSKTYTLTQKFNEKAMGFDGTATYNGSDLSIAGSLTEGSSLKIIHNTYSTTIKVSNITTPGTYVASINYISNQRKVGIINTWSSDNQGGNATVVVTAIDPVSKKISGTFKGMLVLTSAVGHYQTTTEGSFNLTYK
ncbi:hypothetical protein ACFQZS_12875 [Mucilaginibacter calamicampi]|uniref:Carboxypeptidase regulatory-like domain-containing protein n=1 Tax=Mucilaginibacter calamicampi TaxID=1302352 RepID=A0ABW2YX11_9SPHI